MTLWSLDDGVLPAPTGKKIVKKILEKLNQ
jgi:hypothetical protein